MQSARFFQCGTSALAYWTISGEYVEVAVDSIVGALLIFGGGQEASTMASGIISLAEQFKMLEIGANQFLC